MYNQKESICVYKCNKQFKGDFQTLTAGHAFEVVDRFNINYWILLEYMKTDRGKKTNEKETDQNNRNPLYWENSVVTLSVTKHKCRNQYNSFGLNVGRLYYVFKTVTKKHYQNGNATKYVLPTFNLLIVAISRKWKF